MANNRPHIECRRRDQSFAPYFLRARRAFHCLRGQRKGGSGRRFFQKSWPISFESFPTSAVAFTLQEFHCDNRVEKIGDAARVQTELSANLRAREPALSKPGEQIKRDRREKKFGIPESEGRLQNCVGCW